MEVGQVEVQQELERLRVEIEQLRAARERLVLAADADRRAIERELHGGVHQRLVALATSLQLARLATGSEAVDALLDEMTDDVRQALEETALLAQGIYPSALELGGLAALLRAAAVTADVPATVDAGESSGYAPEVGMTVYLCWLTLLSRASGDRPTTITVRASEETLTFELAGEASASDLERLQDRLEALGGRLASEPEPGGGVRLSGSLPSQR